MVPDVYTGQEPGITEGFFIILEEVTQRHVNVQGEPLMVTGSRV